MLKLFSSTGGALVIMDIKIEPSGAALGAFVRDIDLNQPLTDALRQQILAAWQKHCLLYTSPSPRDS